MLPNGFDPVSPSFTVRDVITKLSGPRLTSCSTEIYLQVPSCTKPRFRVSC
ncbi:unnamed protein product [Schistosoma curassoni]|uniref:Uncharacterized protein n=1 Tax=Schistosoma curassoni TaxID=6186 RepID=A0A183JMP3_9TREM|nr:unnamed protein product [Schistosoma curassoni]